MFRLAPDQGRAPRRTLRAAIAAAAWLLAAGASALPEDRLQPIRISADQALRDERQGFTEYTGNVRMQQGSLQIEAEKITVFHQQVAADRILAEGSPARLQQQPEASKGIVHASAQVIEYFKAEDRVHLRRQARIEQDGSIVTGNTIDYFMTEQRVRADAGRREDGGRVEVVIPAQALEDGEQDGAPSGAAESE